MTIGIYSITHGKSGKRYIGKSIRIEQRLDEHRRSLTKHTRHKDTNRHLYNAVQRYGWSAFNLEVLEMFAEVDETHIAKRELYWMDKFNTVNRSKGYNLRRDSATRMIVHSETRVLNAENSMGEDNPNYGNHWSDEKKKRMSDIKKQQHADGNIYGKDWRRKQGEYFSKFWKDNPDKKKKMAQRVSDAKQTHDIHQLTEEGTLVKVWKSLRELLNTHPEYKWQNIYAACNGNKKRIYGYKWKRVLKNGQA